MRADPAPQIAYVLKGYPRVSELFIASEIHRVEAIGVPLALYVIKARDEQIEHEVVRRIRAVPDYLPAFGSVSGASVPRWLCENLPAVSRALGRVLRRHPAATLRAAAMAAGQAFRARRSFWSRPRKVYLKEFFQAVALADRIDDRAGIRHLHAHFSHGATTVTWLAAAILSLPFSFTAHAKDIYQEKLNPAGLLSRKMAAALFVTTCTEANRKHLESSCPGARVHTIYHGLNADFECLLAAESTRTGAGGPFSVLGVGRRVAKKGFGTLVRAMAMARADGLDWRLRLVGEDGDASAEISSAVAHHGLEESVTIEPAVLQAELLDRIHDAHVMALPCTIARDGDRDGIPNVLVEAMAAGLPVVSTPVSGIPELVADEENGLLVSPDDAVGLYAALRRLSESSALRQRLAAAGRKTIAERFDARAEVRRLVELLETGGGTG